MFKKVFCTLIIVLLVLVVVGCDNDSDVIDISNVIDIEEVKPNITFSDSKEITKNEVSLFFDRFNEELNDEINACEYAKEFEVEEMTYDEARDLDKTLCGPLYNIDESLHIKDRVEYTENVILNVVFENDTIESSTDLEILISRGLIDIGNDALRFIIYNQDSSRFSQYTFAIVDGELYFEEYEYIEVTSSTPGRENEMIFYRHYVYYENHYQIFDKLDDTSAREHFRMNLETSEFYFYNKSIGYSITNFYYGNDEVINNIYYANEDGNFVSIASNIYKQDVFSMQYNKAIEANENIPGVLVFSALELPGWDLLKGGGNEFYMYDGDNIVYPDYMIEDHAQGTVISFFPAIVMNDYDLKSNTLKIDGSSVDVSGLKDNIDYLSNNYQKILADFNINLEVISIDDAIDEFDFIYEMAEEYLSE
ncbi:MAG: hypothetical protein ACQERX_00780 [Bacillota bacterium]